VNPDITIILLQIEPYKDEILKPWGLTKGTGIIGKTTKAKRNQLFGK
jgi:hypothetical protein